MREILFRGQTRKKGEKVRIDGTPLDGIWVYGGIMVANRERSIIYQIEPNFDKFSVHSETVGQYTGLTDKNGVKIFEGDIVQHENLIVEVAYIEKYTRFAGKRKGCTMAMFDWKSCEVIGNIYDNPELLEVKNG